MTDIRWIFLEGTKIDSIGTSDRGFGDGLYDSGRQGLDSHGNVLPLMQQEGYYKLADGKKVFLLRILSRIAPRAS